MTGGISPPFWASYVLLWFVVVVLAVLVVLMYRQFGLAFMKPVERAAMQGLDIGASAPAFALVGRHKQRHEVRFSGARTQGDPTLVLFALPTCDVCKGLWRTVASMPIDYPGVRFVWVDGTNGSVSSGPDGGSATGWLWGTADADSVHRAWEVSAVPFCFSVDTSGRIVTKQLVNHRSDIDAALRAM